MYSKIEKISSKVKRSTLFHNSDINIGEKTNAKRIDKSFKVINC